MEYPHSFKCQFTAMSVTDVADGERWIQRLIVYTSDFTKNTSAKDVLMFSCSKERLGVIKF